MFAVDVMGTDDWGEGPVAETGYDFPTLEDAADHARREMDRAFDARDFLIGMAHAAGTEVEGGIYIGAYIYGEQDDDDPMSEGAQWSVYADHPHDLYPLNDEAIALS